MCNRCSCWVHSKCSGHQNAAEYRRIKNWAYSSCSSPPTPPIPHPLLSPIIIKASDGDPFTILQFNANVILLDSVDLEVIHCHPNPETRQGLLSQHFLSAYLTPLSSSESYRDSLTSNRQQPPASIRIPTQFPTRTLYHFCFATTDE